MSEGLKGILQTIASIAMPALFVFIICWLLFLRKDWAVNKLEKAVKQEALMGNRIAIAITKYKAIRYDDMDTINEALKGNEYAIEILGIQRWLLDEKQGTKK